MKALTMTQPWASLVALGAKSIETRSWCTRYRGPLAIHAARAFPVWCQDLAAAPTFHYWHKGWLPLGLVICTVDLVDCVSTEDIVASIDQRELEFGNYGPGRFAWVFRNPRLIDPPIQARGYLWLWEWARPQEAA
jgi:hypothetical protein